MVGRGMLLLVLLLGSGQALSSEQKVLTLTVPWGMWKEGPDGQPIACARFHPPKKTWNGVKHECAEYLPPQAYLDTRFKGRAKVVEAKPASAMASALVISFQLVDPAEALPTTAPATTGDASSSGE